MLKCVALFYYIIYMYDIHMLTLSKTFEYTKLNIFVPHLWNYKTFPQINKKSESKGHL